MATNEELLEVKSLLQGVNANLSETKQGQDEIRARMLAVEQHVVGMDARGQGGPSGDLQTATPSFLVINGKQVPILANTDRMSNLFPMSSDSDDGFTLGHYVKSCMGMEKPRFAVTTGPAIVPTYLAGQIYDATRAKSGIVQAGAVTIPLEGKTNICRIETDPTVYQHTEGQEDIEESVPIFSLVEMNPKALVALIPLTHEVVSDSPNLDAALMTSIAAAMALKLDALCLATILADIAIPASETDQAPGSWEGVLSAVGSAMVLNQPIPPAHISNPLDFISRASELSANYGWLSKPKLLENMLEIANNNVTPGYGVFGNFAAGFGIGVRADLQIEVIRFSKAKSYTHVLVAHLRADGYVLQPNQLFIQNAITSGA